MANLGISDLWRARVVCSISDQISVNCVNFNVVAVTGVVTDQEFADYLDSEWGTLFKNLISDDAIYRGVSVQRFKPIPVTVPAVSIVSQGTGSVAGEVLPKQVSGVLTLRTAFAGPGFRGRLYIPFPSETHNQVPGRPEEDYLTALTVLGNQIVDADTVVGAGGNATVHSVLYHRELDTFDRLTGFVARPRWGTQQRRGDYGKQNVVPF